MAEVEQVDKGHKGDDLSDRLRKVNARSRKPAGYFKDAGRAAKVPLTRDGT